MGAYLRKDKAGIEADLESVYQRFPRLAERKNSWPAHCRAASSRCWRWAGPDGQTEAFTLDEPSMGLSRCWSRKYFDYPDINAQGTTVLLVEQNAKMALGIADRAYVLETGSVVLSGTGAELAASEDIKKALFRG